MGITLKRPMTFTEFLEGHQKSRLFVGDLARDVMADEGWPAHDNSYAAFDRRLRDCGACDAALDVFRRAFMLYLLFLKIKPRDLARLAPIDVECKECHARIVSLDGAVLRVSVDTVEGSPYDPTSVAILHRKCGYGGYIIPLLHICYPTNDNLVPYYSDILDAADCYLERTQLSWRYFDASYDVLGLDDAQAVIEGVRLYVQSMTIPANGREALPAMMRPRHKLPSRFHILKRDGYRCQICGRTAQDGAKLEIDHKVPRSKGGTNDESNLWTLCFECNRSKHAHDL